MTAPRYTFCHFWLGRHRLNDTGDNYWGGLFPPPYIFTPFICCRHGRVFRFFLNDLAFQCGFSAAATSSMVPFHIGALGFGATLLPPFRQVAIAEMVPTFL